MLLGAAPAQPAGFRLRGCHPLRPPIPGDSATRPVQCTAPRRGGDGKNAPQTTPRPQPPPGIARARFNHHPLPLATTHGISTPAGTEMFHFPASPPAPYELQTRVTPHNGRRVPPFGNPRITARKPAPRGISQATASFIGPRCQGIHRTLKTNEPTTHNTHRRTTTTTNRKTTISMLASTMQFTTNPPTTPNPPTREEGGRGPGHQGAPPQNPTACHAHRARGPKIQNPLERR